MDRFFDEGEWFEVGIHGTQMGRTSARDKTAGRRGACADMGKVEGAWCARAAYDFTVKGGSRSGRPARTKVTRLRELALRDRMPMVWFIDSAGARIDPQSGQNGDMLSLFAGAGALFREEVDHARRRPAGGGDGRARARRAPLISRGSRISCRW